METRRSYPAGRQRSLHGQGSVTVLWRNTIYLHMVFYWAWLPSSHGYAGLFHPKHDPTEYCEAETFTPECQADQVVVMMTALYGRITKGRCAKVNYGFMGCYKDVLSVMDYMCSGRPTCEVRIPDKVLDEYYDCTGEFKTYLNASYACVQVESTSCESCNSREQYPQAKLLLRKGFISSWVTASRNGCGSAKCPWVIEAPPGQKINLTLFDFSDQTQQSRNSWQQSPCPRFGVIKEKAAKKDTPICKGVARQSHLFTSLSNQVEIHVVSPEVLKTAGQFILYYEAVGCRDYDPPDNTYFKRQDDHITVGCTNNEDSWDLYCVGSEWQGTVGTCPPVNPNPPPGGMSLPLGVLIAIVVGIALVIGVLILTVGIVCLKRQQHDLHQRSETTLYVRARQEPEYREELTDPRLFPKYETTPLTLSQKQPVRVVLPPPQIRGTAAHGGPRENLYFRRMEQRPLPSLPNLEEQPPQAPGPPREPPAATKGYSDDDPDKYRVQVHRTGSGREQHHSQYPPPRVVTRRAHSTGSSSRDDPQYFVLDPDDHLPEDVEPEECASTSASASSAGPRPVRKRTPSGPAGQTSCGSTSLAQSEDTSPRASSCVASTHHSGSGRIEGNSSNNQPPRLSKKPNQKSPEQENVENDTKEVHMNNSCHEIPLRPSREGSQSSKVPETTSSGNSSWP